MSKKAAPGPVKLVPKPRTPLDLSPPSIPHEYTLDPPFSSPSIFNEKEAAAETIQAKGKPLFEEEEILIPHGLTSLFHEWVRISVLYEKSKEIEVHAVVGDDKKHVAPFVVEEDGKNEVADLLIAAFTAVSLSKDKCGGILWELIFPVSKPKDPTKEDVKQLYNPVGKYYIKLFYQNKWRKVIVDDRIPVNVHGVPLLPKSSNPNEIWPLLLSKAILKLFSGMKLDLVLIISSLTGWTPLLCSHGFTSERTIIARLTLQNDAYYWSKEKQISSEELESTLRYDNFDLVSGQHLGEELMDFSPESEHYNFYSVDSFEQNLVFEETPEFFTQPYLPVASPIIFAPCNTGDVLVSIHAFGSHKSTGVESSQIGVSLEHFSDGWDSYPISVQQFTSQKTFISFMINFSKYCNSSGALFFLKIATPRGFCISVSAPKEVVIIEDKLSSQAVAKMYKDCLSINCKDIDVPFPIQALNQHNVWSRSLLKITEATHFRSQVCVSGEAGSFTWITMTNLDNQSVVLLPNFVANSFDLSPNEEGYLLTMQSFFPLSLNTSVPAGKAKIRLLSNSLVNFTSESCATVSEFSDLYKENNARIIFREILAASGPTVISLSFTFKLPSSFDNLELHLIPIVNFAIFDEEDNKAIAHVTGLVSHCTNVAALSLKKGKRFIVEAKFSQPTKSQFEILSQLKNFNWNIRCTSGCPITLSKDVTRENDLITAKFSWEKDAPGRSQKAKETRDKYLSDAKRSENVDLLPSPQIGNSDAVLLNDQLLESLRKKREEEQNVCDQKYQLMLNRRQAEVESRLDTALSMCEQFKRESESLKNYALCDKELMSQYRENCLLWDAAIRKLRIAMLITPPSSTLIRDELDSVLSFSSVLLHGEPEDINKPYIVDITHSGAHKVIDAAKELLFKIESEKELEGSDAVQVPPK